MELEDLNEVDNDDLEESDLEESDDELFLEMPVINKKDLLNESLKGNEKAADLIRVYGEGVYDSYADFVIKNGKLDDTYEYDMPIEVHTRNEGLLGESKNGIEFKEELFLFGEGDKLSLAGVFPDFSSVAEGMVILENVEEMTYEEQLETAREEYEKQYGSAEGLAMEHTPLFEEGVFLGVQKDIHAKVGHTGTGVLYNKD